MSTNNHLKTITLGGGCFWCVEAVFVDLRGVQKVTSGYMGGHVKNPTYQQVCAKNTGHIEVVQIGFDPTMITLQEILEVFFVVHDPTTYDRQGYDVGEPYRSVIFYADEEQKRVAVEVIGAISAENIYPDPIVTQLYPLQPFYIAEDYHQDYFANNQAQPYCAAVIAPKVAKFRKQFIGKLK